MGLFLFVCLLLFIYNFFCSILASLNLPAAIEVTEGNTLPPSILEKAAAVRSLGGLEQLEQMLKELPELFKRNKDILDEVIYLVV